MNKSELKKKYKDLKRSGKLKEALSLLNKIIHPEKDTKVVKKIRKRRNKNY